MIKRENGFFSKALTTQTRETFRDDWYTYMERNRIDIPMFMCFEIYASNNNIEFPFREVNMFQKR